MDTEPTGFSVSRVVQQGQNFDWVQVVTEGGALYCRVDIPYPLAGGPGGPMRVLAFLTPVSETTTRIFFWRARKVQGLAALAWRFLYRAAFEARHWAVLEQDREMLAHMAPDARDRENLYQQDIGVTRMRQVLRAKARAQIAVEADAHEIRRVAPSVP